MIKTKDETTDYFPIVYTPENPRRSERIKLLRIKVAAELAENEKKKELMKSLPIKKRSKKVKVKVVKTTKKAKLISKTSKKVKEPKIEKAAKPKKEKKVKQTKEKGGYFLMNKFTKLYDEDCKDFMDGNCSNQYCKFIHNYSKLWKDKNNEEFARRYYSLYQDFQVLSPYERKIFGVSSLDLLFICDCTGSMACYINEAKNQIKKIIDHIKESNPHSTINVSFVGYRDIKDNELRISSIDFTSDVDKVKAFIEKQDATGGGDTPEDVTGGLNEGLKLSWSAKAKFTIFIADAPCHGKKYHDEADDYPKGCPNGLILEDLIKEYARREITFSVMKITTLTDKMFKIMNESYKEVANTEIQINDLKTNPNDFGIFISHAASTTLNSITFDGVSIKDFLNNIQKDTVSLTEATNQEKEKIHLFITRMNNLIEEQEKVEMNKETQMDVDVDNESKQTESSETKGIFDDDKADIVLKYNIDIAKEIKAPANWNEISQFTFNSKCHSFNIPKDRNSYINWKNPFIKHSFINSEVKIADFPFSEGAMRYAFFMKDLSLEQNLVGKINKSISNDEYNLEGLSKDLLSLVVSKRIAYDFNERIINLVSDTKMLINFVESYIYEMINYSSNKDITVKQLPHHNKYFSAENFIDGDYTKFNNNAGWIANNLSEQSQIAQAFSHFSWQFTKGYLMIVDLQGLNSLLTDPQIHCLDRTKFGKGNLGYIGIVRFFMTHVCNSFCKKLELIHPRTYKNIDKDYDFFIEKYEQPAENKIVNKLCDICKVPFKANAFDLYDKKKKCWDAFCNDCDKKRKESFQGRKCVTCGGFFKSSAYIFKMRREEFPKACQKCKINERVAERKEFDAGIMEQEDEV